MVSSKKTGFCKNEDCPTSNELLEYQKGDSDRRAELRRHLALCEFCAAEHAFYSRFPLDENTEEGIAESVIPAPLYQLAEALLKKKHSDPTSLDAFLSEPPAVAGG